jgi:tetratricopeptide (TPR) repeat protein
MEDNRLGVAEIFHQLGMLALARDDLDTAESWYRKSLAIELDLDGYGRASAYHQLGIIAWKRGNFDAAEVWYQQTLEVRLELGQQQDLASIGWLAQDRGAFSAAETWYRKAIDVSEQLDDLPILAKSYGLFGLLAEKRGDRTAALEAMVRCVALFPEPRHPGAGPIPYSLARLTAELGPDAITSTWLRLTGQSIPDAVRDDLIEIGRILTATESESPIP